MSYDLISDISYVSDGHIRQKLDLYTPKSISTSTNTEPYPLILYIHGGAFKFGSKKNDLLPVRLLQHNYAIASLDYRLSGDVIFPAAVQDCKSALRYLRAHASKYNIDPSRVVAFGESAGAHHSSMLGTTSQDSSFDVGEYLDQSSAVQGVVDYYGPTDFLQMDAHAPPPPDDGRPLLHNPSDSPESLYLGQTITECPDLVARANPITYITQSSCPPFFIAHGEDDHVVPFHQSVIFAEALMKKGVQFTILPVKGTDHVFKGISEEQTEMLNSRTDEFLKKVFGR